MSCVLQGLILQHPTRFVSGPFLLCEFLVPCSRARIPSNGLAALPSTPYLDAENGKLFPTEGRGSHEPLRVQYALRNCLSALGLCSSFPREPNTSDRFVYPRVLLSEELSLHLRNSEAPTLQQAHLPCLPKKFFNLSMPYTGRCD